MSAKERDVFHLVVVVFLCALSVVYTKHVDNNIRYKRTVAGENSCENVMQFFALKNITVPRDSSKGKSENKLDKCGGDVLSLDRDKHQTDQSYHLLN